MAETAGNTWTGNVQANSDSFNNYAYSDVSVSPAGPGKPDPKINIYLGANNVDVGGWGSTERHPDGTYTIFISQEVFNYGAGPSSFAQAVMNQEIGHVFGFDDIAGCSTATGMGDIQPGSFITWGASTTTAINYNYPPGQDPYCNPTECSPILINMADRAVLLTSPDVLFDIKGLGQAQLFGWTQANSEVAFLVLDRNGNGTIDTGREMFGNYTPLGSGLAGPQAKDGYQALAWFDDPANGGNGDGRVSAGDRVFSELRLWFDRNHNGYSESEELVPLGTAGVLSIDLATHEANRRDAFGNVYRLRSDVYVQRAGRSIRTESFDVFLATER